MKGIGLNGSDQGIAAQNTRNEIVALLPRLRRFCRVLAGSPEAADDLAQNTVVRALERIDQWQTGTRLDSWMFRIAQNINIDEARSASRKGISVDLDALEFVAGDDGRQIAEARSDMSVVRRAVAALPDDQRTLVALVIIEGQSYKDAAAALEIPIGTVMSRLARARQTLAAAVEPNREFQ